jgi:hypothetical protein
MTAEAKTCNKNKYVKNSFQYKGIFGLKLQQLL